MFLRRIQLRIYLSRARSRNALIRGLSVQRLKGFHDLLSVRDVASLLQHPDAGVRDEITFLLGELNERDAFAYLLPLLSAQGEGPRIMAAKAVGNLAMRGLTDPHATEPLIAQLQDESQYVRQAAAATLYHLRDPRSADALLAALNDSDAVVQACAIRAVGALREPRAVAPLLRLLQHEYAFIVDDAAKALEQVSSAGDVETALALLANPRTRVAAIGMLAKAQGHEGALQALIALLDDKDWGVRQRAAHALGEMGRPESVEPLIRTMQRTGLGDSGETEIVCAYALGRLKDARAVRPLIAKLKQPYGRLRMHAAIALGEIGDAAAVEPLVACLKDSKYDPQVMAIVYMSLRQLLGEEKMPSLIQRLHRESPPASHLHADEDGWSHAIAESVAEVSTEALFDFFSD